MKVTTTHEIDEEETTTSIAVNQQEAFELASEIGIGIEDEVFGLFGIDDVRMDIKTQTINGWEQE